MKNIIGVRFKRPGKIYFFDPGELQINLKDYVIVETSQGEEMGEVAICNRKLPDEKVVAPLKPVIRIATAEDKKHNEENKEKEKEAFKICQEKIKKHKLDMNLLDVEYKFDNSKILFFFTADGRIDFRELVKDLAAIFKTRIELRHIRDRLFKELERNVSLRVKETESADSFEVCGRGELHLSVLIETMRREGFELLVSRPKL